VTDFWKIDISPEKNSIEVLKNLDDTVLVDVFLIVVPIPNKNEQRECRTDKTKALSVGE
jgi:hypothetical protein